MRATKYTKYTLKITAEALSIDTLSGLVSEAMSNIIDDKHDGELLYEDGDTVEWSIETQDVKF